MSNTDNKLSEDSIIKCYRRYAPFYDHIFGKILQHGRTAAIEEIIQINPDNILEIGVGTGLMLPMYPQNTPITGIDISDEMLNKAKDKIPINRSAEISLLKVNGEHLPFETNSFECVILPYTYSVTPKPKVLINEARRVCHDNGHIIIINHFSGFKSPWSALEFLAKPLAKKIGFSSDFSYKENIEDLNLSVIKNYPVNIFHLSRVVIIRNNKDG